MLGNLKISNYALIDNSEIAFEKGLNIITGETGAGKSILLGALGLLMGQRAETQVLFDKEKKCVVEGEFEVKSYNLQDFFYQNELDYSDTCIIRREISSSGTSRAFVNDTPVNLNLLKELSSYLVDIHSQHQTLALGNGQFQLNVLDAVSMHASLLDEYRKDYKNYKSIQKDLAVIQEQEANSRKEQDYLQFQFNELEEADLEKINQAELEEELETLNNAEDIKRSLMQSIGLISDSEVNILQMLAEVKPLLNKFSAKNKSIEALAERLNSSILELKDLNNEITSVESDIVYSPSRIDEINGMLDKLYRLQKKHNVNSVDALKSIREEISSKLNTISSLEEQIKKLSVSLDLIKKELLKKADQLHQNRTKAVNVIENNVHEQLALLSMKNAQLKIELSKEQDLNNNGYSKVSFLFSANKGSDLNEISKVASGGELSRLMLCIKNITAKSRQLPSIIFDEIDTGVSGDVADKIGLILNDMALNMQIVAITHLPQMASKGSNHLFVYKEDVKNRTISHIKKLSKQERIEEVAKMLSTGKPTETALQNAKELLNLV
jgi:DNA repair protein RecN (Recombination protein N)